MVCARFTDVRKRVAGGATLCALIVVVLVATLDLSNVLMPQLLAGSVLVAYIIHWIGVLEDRPALFHLGLYGAAYAHGMQIMYYYRQVLYYHNVGPWYIPAVSALALAACCCAYTGFTIGLMARAEQMPSTVQPARECGDEDESKDVDYV